MVMVLLFHADRYMVQPTLLCFGLDLSLSSWLEDSVLAELNSLRSLGTLFTVQLPEYSLVDLSQKPVSLIGTLA